MSNNMAPIVERVPDKETTTPERDEALIRERLETYRAIIAGNLAEGFTQMPDQVRKDSTLSRAAKLVYEQLLCYARQKDCCWPSQQSIAEAIVTISRRTVIRAINELYERGYIEKWRRGFNRTNIYYINPLTFSASFKRPQRGRGVLLDARSPELQVSAESTPHPDILISLSRMCQNGTSRSDKMALQEATKWHTKHTESNNTQIERDTDESKIRVPEGRGLPNPAPTYSHIAQTAIRSEQNTEGTNTTKNNDTIQIEISNQSNNKEFSGAARAKDVKKEETRKKPRTFEDMAALVGISPKALADMLAWLRENQRPETTPLKLQGIIPQWSRELGNAEPHLIAANLSQASKLYRYARLGGLGQQAVEECFEHARVAVSNHPQVRNKMAFFFTSLKLDILVALKQYKDLPASRSAIPDGYDDGQAQEQEAAAEGEVSGTSYFAAGDSLRSAAPEETAVATIFTDDPQAGWSTYEGADNRGEHLLNELDPYRMIYTWAVRPTPYGRWGFEVVRRKGRRVERWCLNNGDILACKTDLLSERM